MIDRRMFLRSAAIAAGAAVLPRLGKAEESSAAVALPPPQLMRFPEKTDLILVTDRPPNLETPLKYFRDDLTPNEAFFVRWHLGIVPTSVDPASFRLAIKGHVDSPQGLTLDELRKSFEPVSLVAVNQCSGNSRALFEP